MMTSALTDLTALEEPTWDDVRQALKRKGAAEGEWAGLPLPSHHCALVMEPRHPYAHMNGFKFDQGDSLEDRPVTLSKDLGGEVINEWRHSSGDTIYVWKRFKDGKSEHMRIPSSFHKLNLMINTMGTICEVFDTHIEVEAHKKLAAMVSDHAYSTYFMTGMFLESSKRSGVTYLFRKLKPTIAMKATKGGMMKVLSCLCLHPIAYYENTWAGALCPTDDVIAHLMLMRGDEPYFWRKANHHGVLDPQAGI